ncbi:NACHT, LRR and PYD domains-containing protein 5-like protein [Lates japonicus]|uniref:NACHT, LRR and PYD domains-containing protein 5-like protein n=1 Tax=Lates japonicus TaxID=270547 RepID=A0AAD3NKJ2_LATJO|nr:NACHT, LRR and PYD domains-containing protein 5-like protein [Lates japonicus]GLD72741.1 NACHT, LRR and PYD domains-containing protein 5-like protein [Lates japonicus]
MPVLDGGAEFEKLTRQHAVDLQLTVSCSVQQQEEAASSAVGKVVAYDSVKSASRANCVTVTFLPYHTFSLHGMQIILQII